MTNPVTSSGDVFGFLGFTPTYVIGSFDLDVFANPFDFLTSLGADLSSADELVFGAEYTVPEPISMGLMLSGLSGLAMDADAAAADQTAPVNSGGSALSEDRRPRCPRMARDAGSGTSAKPLASSRS